jgi:hypothetical protein
LDGAIGDFSDMAADLLHEMGHVYNFLVPQGSGGAPQITQNDVGQASNDNSLLVWNTCGFN